MNYFRSLIILLILVGCSQTNFKTKWTQETAPGYFTARFETSKGNFDIEARREWSPLGVDRLYQLIKHGFYTDIAIFRVVPDYVAQFGIHNDPEQNKAWSTYTFADEPVRESNVKGAIAFARGGVETRTTQIFINLKDNHPRLDTLSYSGVTGFPVIAKVTSGMDIVEQFYSGYGDELGFKQDSIQQFGNEFIRAHYPKTDFIYQAYLLQED